MPVCARADSERIEGLYYFGLEVETLHPCGNEGAFWVVGEDALLQPLREMAAGASKAKPYQPIYVSVSAGFEGKANDGFAADYDGVYRITAVHEASASVPPDCLADGERIIQAGAFEADSLRR